MSTAQPQPSRAIASLIAKHARITKKVMGASDEFVETDAFDDLVATQCDAFDALIRWTPGTIDDLIAVLAHALPFEDCLENCHFGDDERNNALVLFESILRALRGIQARAADPVREAA